MSALADWWLTCAKASIGVGVGDRLICSEGPCPIMRGRTVAIGAVVDGRRWRPGLVLLAVTSDPLTDVQELGVTSAGQARTIIEALYTAWPELRPKAAP